MGYLTFGISTLLLIVIFYFIEKNINIERIGIALASSLIFTLSFVGCGHLNKTLDTEYLNGYVLSAVNEKEWDEYINQTCTREVSCGTNSDGSTKYCTETYDCSYVDTHYEKWYVKTTLGTISISEGKYYELTRKYNNNKIIGVNRGYTYDGDIYATYWNNNVNTLVPITQTHTYTNKVAVGESIYKFDELNEIEKKKIYEYPRISTFKFNYLIGYNNNNINKKLRFINAKMGSQYQITNFILVFRDIDENVGELQRMFWKNGNKNESIYCYGINNDNKIVWTKHITWSESEDFKYDIGELMFNQIDKDIDKSMSELLNKLPKLINSEWKRKEFKDFDYIEIHISWYYYLLAFIFSIIGGIVANNLIFKKH